HPGRPPTVIDVLPEVFQGRAYAPHCPSGPLSHRLLHRYASAIRTAHESRSVDERSPHLGHLFPTSGGTSFYFSVVDETNLTHHLSRACSDYLLGQRAASALAVPDAAVRMQGWVMM